MKKTLISLFSLSLLGSVHAACDNAVSFSGAFGGLGAVVSFDEDTVIGEIVDVEDTTEKTKKSKTAFGGQIVLGYGHHFDNNMYIALMHESNFLSKANHEFTDSNDYVTGTFKTSRKVWVPTFGIAAGYIVDDINFGIRGGVSINKFKYEQNIAAADTFGADKKGPNAGVGQNGDTAAYVGDGQASKTLTETSPFIGVYVEKKFGDFIGYMNVDYVFKKQKIAHDSTIMTWDKNNANWGTATTDTNHTEHKRPSWKVAVGVKYHLPIF